MSGTEMILLVVAMFVAAWFGDRVLSLALKVSVASADQPPYVIRLLEWPAPGLEPSHPAVRDAASSAHDIFQRLAEGMAKAGSSRA